MSSIEKRLMSNSQRNLATLSKLIIHTLNIFTKSFIKFFPKTGALCNEHQLFGQNIRFLIFEDTMETYIATTPKDYLRILEDSLNYVLTF